jgi:hypothetical protein
MGVGSAVEGSVEGDGGPDAHGTSVLDIDTLRADPARVDQLDADALLDVLDQCSEERDRLAVVERRVQARLRRELPVMDSTTEEFTSDNDACLDDAQARRTGGRGGDRARTKLRQAQRTRRM